MATQTFPQLDNTKHRPNHPLPKPHPSIKKLIPTHYITYFVRLRGRGIIPRERDVSQQDGNRERVLYDHAHPYDLCNDKIIIIIYMYCTLL